jgi:hypothetical protein
MHTPPPPAGKDASVAKPLHPKPLHRMVSDKRRQAQYYVITDSKMRVIVFNQENTLFIVNLHEAIKL